MSAPTAEARLGSVIHTYERVKLALLVLVLLIDIAMGGYLISMARTNQGTLHQTRQALVILECAVNKNTYQNPQGKPLTQADSRKAFDACVQAGGPKP